MVVLLLLVPACGLRDLRRYDGATTRAAESNSAVGASVLLPPPRSFASLPSVITIEQMPSALPRPSPSVACHDHTLSNKHTPLGTCKIVIRFILAAVPLCSLSRSFFFRASSFFQNF
jgi:hypothetical protein